MENTVKWQAAVSNKKKLTVEDAKFLFEQAEKLLKDTIETGAIIVTRTNILVTIVSGVIIGITGFIIKQWETTHIFNDILMTSAISIVYFFVIAMLNFQNIQPNTYYAIGSQPRDLFADIFFTDIIPDDKRIIRLYVSEIENYQLRIERNLFLNKVRWKRYNISLWAVILCPVFFLLTYLILQAIQALSC